MSSKCLSQEVMFNPRNASWRYGSEWTNDQTLSINMSSYENESIWMQNDSFKTTIQPTNWKKTFDQIGLQFVKLVWRAKFSMQFWTIPFLTSLIADIQNRVTHDKAQKKYCSSILWEHQKVSSGTVGNIYAAPNVRKIPCNWWRM